MPSNRAALANNSLARRKSTLPDPAEVQFCGLKSSLASWDGTTGDWYRLSYDSGGCFVFAPGPMEAVIIASFRKCAGNGNLALRRVDPMFVEHLPITIWHRLLSLDEMVALAHSESEISGRPCGC